MLSAVRWVWDVTVWLAHGFGGDGVPLGGLIAAGLWLAFVGLVVLGVLAGVAQLGRAFARGWSQGARSD